MNLDQCLAESGASLLVVAPHPDDESLAAGGLIQRALSKGARVTIVFVTDGDNNPWPQRVLERRVVIGARQRERWGARRREEAQRALRALGAEAATVHHLAWPDGAVTWKLIDETRGVIAQWQTLLQSIRPTMMVLPDLADGHPDHSALHVLLELVLDTMPIEQRPICLSYLLHGRAHKDAPKRIAFDLTPPEQARKRAAILAHKSQTTLSRGRLMRFSGAQEFFGTGIGNQGLRGGRLPWQPPRLFHASMRLLLVDAQSGQHLRIDNHASTPTLLWRDGRPAAHAARAPIAPYYIKLYETFPSPWVFDHWGWQRFDA